MNLSNYPSFSVQNLFRAKKILVIETRWPPVLAPSNLKLCEQASPKHAHHQLLHLPENTCKTQLKVVISEYFNSSLIKG